MRKKQEINDWDFDLYQYLWYSVLNRREDFYEQTPKYFFKMLDCHKKYNNPNADKENKKGKSSVVNSTEFM